MTRSLITLLFFLSTTQIGFAAPSGGSSASPSISGSSSSGSSGAGSYSNSNDGGNQPEDPFAKANQLINSENFSKAHEELKTVSAGGRGADRYNLLGFTARKSGDLVGASQYYEKALELNPKHIGALQYQGELFITLGEIESAKQNLEKIGKICWLFSCYEEKLLKTAIDDAVGS